jgi:hypothetical protein
MQRSSATRSRSSHPHVRNPVLALPSVARLQSLSPVARAELRQLLLELRADAQVRADDCWRRHKAPMAAYWKVVSVYAGHVARVLR